MKCKMAKKIDQQLVKLILELHKIDEYDRSKEGSYIINSKLVGEGLYGTVYELSDELVIKIFKRQRELSCEETVQNQDGFILKDLEGISCFPKVYEYSKKYMIVERIKGISIHDYMGEENEGTVKRTLEAFFEDWFEIFKRGYYPADLHEGNLVVVNHQIKIIDVGYFLKVQTNDYPLPIFLEESVHYDELEDFLVKQGINVNIIEDDVRETYQDKNEKNQ